jgi:hypothetical protein
LLWSKEWLSGTSNQTATPERGMENPPKPTHALRRKTFYQAMGEEAQMLNP